ncbi:MAG TPA: NfeD family protein [Albitalea sp.]|nr:NfeD family protein [Albitalea sp.]
MEQDLAWAILGLSLVIVEMLTGTFYLLMLGLAAFGASAAAYFGQDFPVQAIVAAVVAGGGCWWVFAYRARNATRQMTSIDAGQPASFETWVDREARLARVRYRGAPWDARVEGDPLPEPGALVYVIETDGNTLKVTTLRPV